MEGGGKEVVEGEEEREGTGGEKETKVGELKTDQYNCYTSWVHASMQQHNSHSPSQWLVCARGVHIRPEPEPTRKSGSFGLACDYVGSGRVPTLIFGLRSGLKS